MELLLIFLMLGLSAFFSGSEIAFVVANRLKVEVRARRAGVVGELVSDFLHDPSKFLTTTLVGNNVALVTYSTLMAIFLAQPLAAFWTATLGIQSGVEPAVLVMQTIIASVLVLLLGEILPKSIMREFADRAVFVLALPLKIVYYVLLPLVKLSAWSASFLTRPFKTDRESLTHFLRTDFEFFIRESRESGQLDLDEEESEFLSNVFNLSSMLVKESMIPRTDIRAVEENTSLDELKDKFVETGFSKLPVYGDNVDNVIGIVFAYDLFQEPHTLREIIRPARFVPETKRAKDLLQEFLTSKTSIAIVIDEYGGTAGLVTAEDLLEELFGDIQDEFDTQEEIIRKINDTTFVVSGRVDIDELAQSHSLELPEGDYETVAGFLLEHLGTIPSPNEEFVLNGYRFVILKASANRVDLVKIITED